uniref:T-complex-associated-testis-expressed 1 n=1 Tax=Oryzias sinensis TaxID=183150 RepID=A0A8C7WQY9_9TELE
MRRRIIAEDPDWSITTVPSLSILCLQIIVNNFERNPIFEMLTAAQKEFLQERLSLSLPVQVTASVLPEGPYWRRCCQQKLAFCDVSVHGHSWKRMFLEKHLENIIELFIPNVTDPQTVLDVVSVCEKYVKRLDISQLLVPVVEPQKKSKENNHDFHWKSYVPPMDHFDFNILLQRLTNLEELHLVYRIKQCGMNFAWNMFEMTYRDCETLAKALQTCKTLKLFRLHQSHMDDRKCQLLVKHLMDHPSLEELDFSHNKIGDIGARAISKLLTRNKLQTLNLCNNLISCQGARAIALALSKNCTLESLNLLLNMIKDEGGQAIAEALLNNTTLHNLNLGGNYLTSVTAEAVSKVLTENTTLQSINLSCNQLCEVGGEALVAALSQNSTIKECDVHLTQVDDQRSFLINKLLWANQMSQLKTQRKGDAPQKTFALN